MPIPIRRAARDDAFGRLALSIMRAAVPSAQAAATTTRGSGSGRAVLAAPGALPRAATIFSSISRAAVSDREAQPRLGQHHQREALFG